MCPTGSSSDGVGLPCAGHDRDALTRRIRAPRAAVYEALLDAHNVKIWMVPDGMTSQVHVFNPRPTTSWVGASRRTRRSP